ncbi:DUF928 domain-containing protein, partial [Crocosphaera sp. Alani8]|uniref:DUF928 domain-containing protein n=1 Tax=Crocosphaera sp. Alani8 TaxID=3038952 RepID=UPI00313DF01C
MLSLSTFELSANTYKPDKRQEQQQTQSTTNRGCKENIAQFKILAPSDHIGTTALERPTFMFWWDEVPSSELEISLTQPFVANPLWQKKIQVKKEGILKLELPQDVKLEDGNYVLTGNVPCSIQDDSSSFVRIAFRKVPSEEIDASKSAAENGIWFDA